MSNADINMDKGQLSHKCIAGMLRNAVTLLQSGVQGFTDDADGYLAVFSVVHTTTELLQKLTHFAVIGAAECARANAAMKAAAK